MIIRDYVVLGTSKKGHENLLVKDCTTGMEFGCTLRSLEGTNNSIPFFEMFG